MPSPDPWTRLADALTTLTAGEEQWKKHVQAHPSDQPNVEALSTAVPLLLLDFRDALHRVQAVLPDLRHATSSIDLPTVTVRLDVIDLLATKGLVQIRVWAKGRGNAPDPVTITDTVSELVAEVRALVFDVRAVLDPPNNH